MNFYLNNEKKLNNSLNKNSLNNSFLNNSLLNNSLLKNSLLNNSFLKNIILFSIFLCILGLILIPSSISAADYVVSPNSGMDEDYNNINDAILSINNLNDTYNQIILLDGIYNKNNDINNDISLNGSLKIIAISKENVIIDGKNNGYLFKLGENSNVVFENISFINGLNINGGAISNYGSVEFINCSFKNNQGVFGGAIANFGYLTAQNSSFISNQAIKGGGVYSIGNTTLSSSEFINNSDAIYINGKNSTITSSNILNNVKGIVIDENSNGSIVNYNRILNNTKNGYNLENYGNNTDANLNWWGVNTPTEIANYGENLKIDYWYNIEIVLNDTQSNFEKFHENDTRFYSQEESLNLKYQFTTNIPCEDNVTKLPKFNITVICPFNNTFDRDIRGFSLTWGSGTPWGLPINIFNKEYTVRAFSDNEFVLVKMIYSYSTLNGSDILFNSSKIIPITAQLNDRNNQSIKNLEVEFYLNNKSIGKNTTNKDGIAKLYYNPINTGKYEILAIFNGNDNYSSSNTTLNLNFEKIKPKANNSNKNKQEIKKIAVYYKLITKTGKNIINIYKTKANKKDAYIIKYGKLNKKLKTVKFYNKSKLIKISKITYKSLVKYLKHLKSLKSPKYVFQALKILKI
ncbi:Ig-like domain-containing protein [Methanobrevibacter curvatus]|uniref:Bacterial Ig-like domain protein n=1 Tax=Methanobrevibacter curvatus TaxID=49547 RepID=A0A166B4B5_9EURY|nr:Ig-like domain-containing protein [Methanobrevibacter curvatus]KZX12841.1 bacterial Ig-like domain protein [Methanobrevibacter curvatus]